MWEVRTDLKINSYLYSVNYEGNNVTFALDRHCCNQKVGLQENLPGRPNGNSCKKYVLTTQKNIKLKFLPILVKQYLVNWSVSWNRKFSQLSFGAPRVSKINVAGLVTNGQHLTTRLPVNTSSVDFRLEYH